MSMNTPEPRLTAKDLTGEQVAHMMHIRNVRIGDKLLFITNQHQEFVAIDTLYPQAVIGTVLTAPVKGFAGYYEFKTDLHKEVYRHHLNDLVAIVKDLLTKAQRIRVAALVYTSVEDCKSSLPHVIDPAILEEAASQSENLGYKTKAAHIRRRINQLEKGK